jgi:4-hydroxy-2-oxoheptanedioate aldolase
MLRYLLRWSCASGGAGCGKRMRLNDTKRRLREGDCVYGCFIRYPDPGLCELLALQGFDFLVLDAEHGTIEPRECENMVRAAELRGPTPIVRVPANQPPVILRYLDTGAQGLHVPRVGDAAQADAAVRAVKYWPRGGRGLAGARAASYGQEGPLGDYVAQANEETLVVIQIETREALAQVPEIAATDGVDVVFIGPTDLSQALGVPGQTTHPSVEEAFDEIIRGVAGSDVAIGVLAADAAGVQAWRERGARYIAVTVDSLLTRGARELLAAVREVRAA